MRTSTSFIVSLAAALIGTVTAAGAQVRPIPQGPAGTVTLPVVDYDRLLDRAAQPPTSPDRPPVAAVVGRAELRARVDGDTVRGTVRLEGEVFQRGAVKVPLVSGATLLDARSDGRPLPLLQDGDVHAAVLPGPAPFVVTVDWASALGAVPGRASFTLPLPASSSVSAIVDLPGDPADVRVEPGLVTRRDTANGRTVVEIALERGRRAQVSWSVRETAAQGAPAETRTLADVRSLVTIGEAEVRMVSLIDVTVVRGEPRTFDVVVPAGYEVATVTGSSLDTSESRGTTLTLTVREPARRRHQFLVSLEQAHAPGSFKLDTPFPVVAGAQRETGEAAIEGIGTLEVAADGDDRMRRMDVREVNPSLRALARQPLLAAFRYQRRPSEALVLAVDVKRFADAQVVPAAAEHAMATTLVTSEGRMLTEMTLRVRNRAQPFMKVTLPTGATMLSVDAAGEPAKPVIGADGTRIPLLRPGFRPAGAYDVSFVYLHAGQALARRGDTQMSLPVVDVPVSVLEWELFLPGQYAAKPTGGNVIPAELVAAGITFDGVARGGMSYGTGGGIAGGNVPGGDRVLDVRGSANPQLANPGPGQVVGRLADPSGAVIPGVTVTAVTASGQRLSAVTDGEGVYVLSGVPSGMLTLSAEIAGFAVSRMQLTFNQSPRRIDFRLEPGSIAETLEVRADAPTVQTSQSEQSSVVSDSGNQRARDPQQVAPSQNVLNLQRRVAGVLPVRVDVPRAGTQYRFVRPLVMEEETTVSFRYKTR